MRLTSFVPSAKAAGPSARSCRALGSDFDHRRDPTKWVEHARLELSNAELGKPRPSRPTRLPGVQAGTAQGDGVAWRANATTSQDGRADEVRRSAEPGLTAQCIQCGSPRLGIRRNACGCDRCSWLFRAGRLRDGRLACGISARVHAKPSRQGRFFSSDSEGRGWQGQGCCCSCFSRGGWAAIRTRARATRRRVQAP